MAAPVSIIHQPGENDNNICIIRPANSPFIVEFATEVVGVAQKATAAILPGGGGGAVVNGDVLTINNIQLNCSDTPAFGELPTSAIATQQQITGALYAILVANTAFSTLYDVKTNQITTGQYILYITAKAPGPVYNISITTTTIYFNPVGLSPGTVAFRGNQYRNYAIWVDVYATNFYQLGLMTDQAGTKVASLFKSMPASNEFYFDLSASIQYFCKGTPGFLETSLVTECLDILKHFYIQYGEQYNESFGSQIRNTLGIIGQLPTGSSELVNHWWVMAGAQANDLLQTEIDTLMLQYHIPVQNPPVSLTSPPVVRFLTTQPQIKLTNVNNNQLSEFLYFIFIPPYSSKVWYLVCNVTLCYLDGTTYDYEAFVEVFPHPDWGGVYFVNVSYARLQLNQYEISANIQIAYYQISLSIRDVYNTTPLTVTQIYQLLNENRCAFSDGIAQNQFIAMWINNLGGYDTFQFIGTWVAEATDLLTQQYMRIPNLRYQDSNEPMRSGEVFTMQSQPVYKLQLISAYVNAAHYKWLQGLLSSPEIYIYCPTSPLPGQTSDAQYRRFNVRNAAWSQDANTLEWSLSVEGYPSYQPNFIQQ